MTNHLSTTHFTWLACFSALAACSDNSAAPQTHVYNASALHTASAAGSGTTVDAGPRLDGPVPPPSMKLHSTQRIGQLTGVAPNAYRKLGMTGTDLGISFPADDKLYFLFGDTLTPNWQIIDSADLNLDSVASSNVTRQADIPTLTWATRETGPNKGKFLPFELKSADPKKNFGPLRAMSVPVEGIALNDTKYIFYHVAPDAVLDAERPDGAVSALAHTEGPGFSNLVVDHVARDSKFRSVSVVRTGGTIWIFGAEIYRKSPVWLALATPETLTQRDRWEYYTGLNPESGEVLVAKDESGAQKLVDESCVGELSVRKHPTRDLYFMTYNCGPDGDHTIQLRTARHPAGPWSAPVQIYSTAEASFLTKRNTPSNGPSDQLGFAGDVYGPYMVPEWFNDTPDGQIEIVYTLSSWLPYQVHLMRSVLTETPALEPDMDTDD